MWLGTLKFDEVLDSRVTKGFGAVVNLRFGALPSRPLPGPQHKEAELVLKCANLKRVEMVFPWQRILLFGNEDLSVVEKDIKQLRQDYGLDGILELRGLQELILGWSLPPNWVEESAIMSFAEWFWAEFAQRGRTVKVRLKS